MQALPRATPSGQHLTEIPLAGSHDLHDNISFINVISLDLNISACDWFSYQGQRSKWKQDDISLLQKYQNMNTLEDHLPHLNLSHVNLLLDVSEK